MYIIYFGDLFLKEWRLPIKVPLHTLYIRLISRESRILSKLYEEAISKSRVTFIIINYIEHQQNTTY